MGHLRTWKDDLIEELKQERPILYSGGGVVLRELEIAGHSWVIDGYDGADKFHCNWGWGGSHDGWFSLGGFIIYDKDGKVDSRFNEIESAIFNIYPVQPAKVGIPTFNDTYTSVDYSPEGMELTVNPPYGATSYEWVTDKGVIKSDGSNRATLYSTETTHVKVRAYNELCGVYSDYAQNNVYIEGEPYISGEYRDNESENDREIMRHYVIKEMIPNASVTWSMSNTADFEIVSTDNERISIRCNTPGKTGILKAHIPLQGFNDVYLETTIQAQTWLIEAVDGYPTCGKRTFTPSAIFPNTEYFKWTVSEGVRIISGENDTILVVDISGDNPTEWVQLEVKQNGKVQTTTRTLGVTLPDNVNIQLVERWGKDGNQKALLYADLDPKGWYAYYDWRITGDNVFGMVRNPFAFQIEACMPDYENPYELKPYPGLGDGIGDVLDSIPAIIRNSALYPPLDDLPPMIPTHNPAYAVATFPMGREAEISCAVITPCKSVSSNKIVLEVLTHPPSYSVSYNRSTRSVQLDRQDNGDTATAQENASYELLLYNNFGLVRTLPFDPTERTVSLPLGDLPDGSYYVNVVDSQGEVLCKQYISAY